MMEPFQSALPVLEKLQHHRHEAFFVGGSVRDFILGRKIDDVDIATSATPQEVMAIFPNHVPLGIEHGTVLVMTSNGKYEITTFRTDGAYEDFRRPTDVTFVRSIDEDLGRRDFTMNAIAMDASGKLYDPFQGQHAIQEEEIKTVGNATDRFKEDALRMMRAIRFISQLGFSLHPSVESAIKENAHLLKKIAVERVRVEFEKLLLGPFLEEALKQLIFVHMYKELPGFKGKKKELIACSENLSSLHHLREFWSYFILMLDIQDSERFLKEWKCPNALIKEVEKIVNAVTSVTSSNWTRRLVFDLGESLLHSTARVYSLFKNKDIDIERKVAFTTYASLPIKNRGQMSVNGKDILDWVHKEPGPWLGELIYEIESMLLEERILNNKEHIREWVETCNLK